MQQVILLKSEHLRQLNVLSQMFPPKAGASVNLLYRPDCIRAYTNNYIANTQSHDAIVAVKYNTASDPPAVGKLALV
jgi:hypothetical protein